MIHSMIINVAGYKLKYYILIGFTANQASDIVEAMLKSTAAAFTIAEAVKNQQFVISKLLQQLAHHKPS